MRARPIGARIREACEIVESLGKCSYAQAWAKASPGINFGSSYGNFLRRAVSHGFLTVDKSVYPCLYSAAPDWREQIEKTDKPVKAKRHIEPPKRIINSVWGLAA